MSDHDAEHDYAAEIFVLDAPPGGITEVSSEPAAPTTT
jgi:hypothetical protein